MRAAAPWPWGGRDDEAPSSSSCGTPAVTLVVAHPDDECMFFTPAIARLAASGRRVTLLCLSTGDACGLGRVRCKEIIGSCASLGIPAEAVEIVDDPKLRDGMDEAWDPDRIATHVAEHLQARQSRAVLTFDRYGVSRHPNHIAVAAGTRIAARATQPKMPVWCLVTHALVVRFLGPLAIAYQLGSLWRLLAAAAAMARGRSVAFPTTAKASSGVCVVAPSSVPAWRAMAQHRSQWVWFRVLYLIASSYVWCNTFQEAA